MRKTYSTDLSNEEWACLRARLPELLGTVRMRVHTLRDVFDAIFYVLGSGCPWRMSTSHVSGAHPEGIVRNSRKCP
jgi:putative transposase